MKVVDVAEFYSPTAGGVRTYVDQKLAAGAALGVEVVVIAPGAEAKVEHRHGGRVIWVPSQRLVADGNYRLFWNFKPIHDILDAEQPDVVEAGSPWTAAWVVAAWPGRAAKTMFLHVDPVASYPYRWFGGFLSRRRIDQLFAWFWVHMRALDRRIDATIASGDWLADRMASYGMRRPRVAPLGVDTGAFSPRLRDAALRREYLAKCGLPEDAMLLIGVGRHHPDKRWPFLMRVTQDPRIGKPVGFVLFGAGMKRAGVDEAAAKLNYIHVSPRVEHATLARIMASADGLIHGSGAETFGLAIGEAVASGLPIIVPDTGGSADLAKPDYAETYHTGDYESAVMALKRFLARDRAGMSVAAAAAHLTSPTEHFTRLFTIYAELAGRGSVLVPEQVAVAP